MRSGILGMLAGVVFAGFLGWAILLWQDDRLPLEWSDWESWVLIGSVVVSLVLLGLARARRAQAPDASGPPPSPAIAEDPPAPDTPVPGPPPEDRAEETADPRREDSSREGGFDLGADPWAR